MRGKKIIFIVPSCFTAHVNRIIEFEKRLAELGKYQIVSTENLKQLNNTRASGSDAGLAMRDLIDTQRKLKESSKKQDLKKQKPSHPFQTFIGKPKFK